MQPLGIKICGLKSAETLDETIRLGYHYAGLVFFPASPRHVSLEQAAALVEHAGARIKPVAVTVDANDALLSRIASDVRPAYVQLHGNETPQRAAEIRSRFGLPVIKALKVRESDDIAHARAFAGSADMLLFDAKPPLGGLPGGNGLAFDWKLLHGRDIGLPWFLSGGLSAENISQAIRLSGARLVDVSSSVEQEPGIKSPPLMREFVAAVHQAQRVG